ncbi:TPA: hypothetical protein ACP69P_004829 [Escherichia coli]
MATYGGRFTLTYVLMPGKVHADDILDWPANRVRALLLWKVDLTAQ